jgi:hypothetical protein
MKLVQTLVLQRGDGDLARAQIAFHRAAGVDVALVASLGDDSASVAADSHVVLVPTDPEADLAAIRRTLLRLAATEHGADWVLDTDADEFWWPRAENLIDAIAAMPPRYGVVQGLVREFVPRIGDDPFSERMTLRTSLHPPAEADPVEWALRPVYRADPDPVLGTSPRGRVPLRAWYPFEVLRFPLRNVSQARARLERGRQPRSSLEAAALAALETKDVEAVLEATGAGRLLVPDLRVRDALRALADRRKVEFRPPDIVEDAEYAVECAAVGEVDLPRLEREIATLEARVIELEKRFWPRVQRRLARAVRRA